MRQILSGAATEEPEEAHDEAEGSNAVYGGGDSLSDKKLMWGPRASRALESLSGKSTGRTSFENEALKKKHFKDQKTAEAKALAAAQEARAAKGESRAALRRKKKKGSVEPTPGSSKKAVVEPTPQFRKRLEAFYKRYAPEKLQEASKTQTLLEKFAQDPDSLFAMLTAKYGPEGMQPAPMTSAKAKRIQADAKDERADALLDECYMPQSKKAMVEVAEVTSGKATTAVTSSKGNVSGAPDEPFSYNTREEVKEMDNDLEKLNAINVNFFMQQARAKPRRPEE